METKNDENGKHAIAEIQDFYSEYGNSKASDELNRNLYQTNLNEFSYFPDSKNEILEFEFEEDDEEPKGCMKYVSDIQNKSSEFWIRHRKNAKTVFLILCAIGYLVYFVKALTHSFGDEGSLRLVFITLFIVVKMGASYAGERWGEQLCKKFAFFILFLSKHALKINLIMLSSIYLAVLIVVILDFVIYSADPYNLVSLAGIFVFISLLFIFSVKPSKVKWRTVAWGFALQLAFALLILRWSSGYTAFRWFGDRVLEMLAFVNSGSTFLFGPSYRDHFFAMQVLPFVVFISSMVSVLFYLGAMEWIIFKLAWIMQACMDITAGESVSAAGNIFIGQTEAPLLIRPILHLMTDSEIHAMMTSGFATIAGSALSAFILFGVPANHLLSASVMSAPAALAIAKLSYPETNKSLTSAVKIKSLILKSPEKSLIEAAATGAIFALPLVANIAAVLIAFISMLELVNTVLKWFGDRVGSQQPFTFEVLCSYIMWPVALVMGIHVEDCRKVAQLVGIKTFINEFVAYESLSKLISNQNLINEHVANNGSWSWTDRREDVLLHHADGNFTKLIGGVINDRSVVISTYALCGFSNMGSIGVQIGIFSALVPSRKSSFSRIALRAMVSGSVACFVTACIAGVFYGPAK